MHVICIVNTLWAIFFHCWQKHLLNLLCFLFFLIIQKLKQRKRVTGCGRLDFHSMHSSMKVYQWGNAKSHSDIMDCAGHDHLIAELGQFMSSKVLITPVEGVGGKLSKVTFNCAAGVWWKKKVDLCYSSLMDGQRPEPEQKSVIDFDQFRPLGTHEHPLLAPSISAEFSAQFSSKIGPELPLLLSGGIGGPPPVHLCQLEVTQVRCWPICVTSSWCQHTRGSTQCHPEVAMAG